MGSNTHRPRLRGQTAEDLNEKFICNTVFFSGSAVVVLVYTYMEIWLSRTSVHLYLLSFSSSFIYFVFFLLFAAIAHIPEMLLPKLSIFAAFNFSVSGLVLVLDGVGSWYTLFPGISMVFFPLWNIWEYYKKVQI